MRTYKGKRSVVRKLRKTRKSKKSNKMRMSFRRQNKRSNRRSRSRYSRRTRMSMQKGGGILSSMIPQDLLSSFENIGYGAKTAASNLMGSVSGPQDPNPTNGQGIDMNYKVIPAGVVDIPSINTMVADQISKM